MWVPGGRGGGVSVERGPEWGDQLFQTPARRHDNSYPSGVTRRPNDDVCIVVPMFNEATSIGTVVSELLRHVSSGHRVC